MHILDTIAQEQIGNFIEMMFSPFSFHVGFVYFIQIKDHPKKPIKIGFTRRSVTIRLRELQQQIPFYKLALIGSFKGSTDDERILKKHFRDYKIASETLSKRTSEWFKSEKSVVDDIVKLLQYHREHKPYEI